MSIKTHSARQAAGSSYVASTKFTRSSYLGKAYSRQIRICYEPGRELDIIQSVSRILTL
jgi:hypothetical protein